jgi:hypothetical protein
VFRIAVPQLILTSLRLDPRPAQDIQHHLEHIPARDEC